MSETPEGYGTQSTPDMGESYPPQTGDLLGSYIARLSARVRELEAASIEPSAYQRSLEARIERLEQAAQPEPTAEPAVTTPAVCATCGHEWRDHSDTGGICMGGVMGKPCRCTEYKPVASEG